VLVVAFGDERAFVEFGAVSDEITIADVEVELFSQANGNASERLISDHSVFAIDRGAAVNQTRVESSRAGADADVRLKSAATVEVIEQVGHRAPGVDVCVHGREAREFNLVEAVTKLAFETETVLEGVAETEMLGPIVFESAFCSSPVQILSAVERPADIGAAIPAFSRVRDAGGARHQCRKRDRFGDARFHIHPSKVIPYAADRRDAAFAPSALYGLGEDIAEWNSPLRYPNCLPAKWFLAKPVRTGYWRPKDTESMRAKPLTCLFP